MLKLKNKITSWLRRQARMRTAINELNALSDRDLSDMGIARADISRVVRGKPREVSII